MTAYSQYLLSIKLKQQRERFIFDIYLRVSPRNVDTWDTTSDFVNKIQLSYPFMYENSAVSSTKF